MKRSTLIQVKFTCIIGLLLLLNSNDVVAETGQECQQKGYQNCLDVQGECTSSSYSCEDTCSADNQCFFDCCYNGYCTFSKNCSLGGSNVLAIVLPIVFGVFFIIVIIVICVRRKQMKEQKKKLEKQNEKNHHHHDHHHGNNSMMPMYPMQQPIPNQAMYPMGAPNQYPVGYNDGHLQGMPMVQPIQQIGYPPIQQVGIPIQQQPVNVQPQNGGVISYM